MATEALHAGRTSVAGYGVQQGLIPQAYEKLRILFTDLLPANFTCIIPNALSWTYRSMWTGSVRSYTFQSTSATTTKVAHLFVHGDVRPRSDGRIPDVLLLHGEQSHPLTMLHLADIAQDEGRAVFSVYLPYDDVNPEGHLYVDAGHLGVINHPDTIKQFRTWVAV
jgi:hypothetical protein